MRDEYLLLGFRRCADSNLKEVPHGIHRLGEPSIRSLLCPQERLGVRLWKDPR